VGGAIHLVLRILRFCAHLYAFSLEGFAEEAIGGSAAEADGRVRLAHAENNDEGTLKRFADGQVAGDAHVVTDGFASYNERSLNERSHDMIVQTKQGSAPCDRALELGRFRRPHRAYPRT
jgi:hypothetical protein